MKPSTLAPVFAVLFLAFAATAAAQDGTGLTLSLCTASTDCKAPRQCYDATTTTTLSPCRSTADNPSLCACQPTEVVSCSTDAPCADGEACARTMDSPNYCADPRVVAEVPELFSADEPAPTVAPSADATPAPVWQAIARKPVGDVCTTPLECGDNLYCLAFTGAQPGTPFCSEGETCRCVPRSTVKCLAQEDCPGGSSCVGVNGGATVCLDPQVAEEVPGLLPAASLSPLPTPAAATVAPRETPAATTPDAPTPAASTPAVTPEEAESVAATPDAPAVSPSPLAPSEDASPSASPSVSPSTSVGASTTPSPTASVSVGASPSVSASAGPSQSVPVAAPDGATPEPEASGEVLPEASGSPTPAAESASDDEDAEPTPTPVCIAAHHLDNHAAHTLVFAEHVSSKVLCDASLSCATATHIVVFAGKPMSMRKYCAVHADCVEKTMLVNSPKYARGLRVPSRTDGLEFTAFAARFGTRVEEHVLSAAVRLSL